MLHFAVEEAFDDLLCCWRAHHSATNRPGATLRERSKARIELDRARSRMRRLRLAIYPEEHERADIARTVWCDTLDLAVHLRWDTRDPMRPGNFVCGCGELVPID